MELTINKTVRWEAAHSLPHMPAGHKCRHLHGHSYTLTVGVRGEVNRQGIVWDFADLKGLIEKHVVQKCDHRTLNDVVGNPTGENLVIWIVERLQQCIPGTVTLVSVELREGMNNSVSWVE